MFGFRHAKFDAMTYVIQHKNGEVKREGRGLSFFYSTYNSSLIAIPMGSNDTQFLFHEVTSDHQTVTVQGHLSYTIENAHSLASVLDFSLDEGGDYKKDDYSKLQQRIVNTVQAKTANFIHSRSLREVLKSDIELEQTIAEELTSSQAIQQLGLRVLSVNVLGVKASPEMARALEAEMREQLNKEADQAVYERRNFAVEQERRIKETELNTEIAVKEKQKQIAAKRMEIEETEAQNKRKLREMKMEADVAVENKNKTLVELQTENNRKKADATAYAIEAQLKPYRDLDWRTLYALQGGAGDAAGNIGLAFREMAENATKIGTLNITPDLLETVASQGRR